jgi:hypothetical protein
MADYNVQVQVDEIIEGQPGYSIRVFPERITLDGREGNTIIWSMLLPSVGRFESREDIEFITSGGKQRFSEPQFDNGRITVNVLGLEQNETIYNYALTVHVGEGTDARMIRVDPEVDNPPPPPTGPPPDPRQRSDERS